MNIWWSLAISIQGVPFAQVQWIHVLKFFKHDISKILVFFSQRKKYWIPCLEFKSLFKINPSEKHTYDAMIDATPLSLWIKITKLKQMEWWKDWVWVKEIPFKNYKPRLGYEWIYVVMPLGSPFNHNWDLASISS